ncbi:MAG: hypothetical protein EBU23_14115, partial [Mycobacteriaceae bacterium]|nr:hypothetical protein [Mycobacteriaceae bacterium]
MVQRRSRGLARQRHTPGRAARTGCPAGARTSTSAVANPGTCGTDLCRRTRCRLLRRPCRHRAGLPRRPARRNATFLPRLLSASRSPAHLAQSPAFTCPARRRVPPPRRGNRHPSPRPRSHQRHRLRFAPAPTRRPHPPRRPNPPWLPGSVKPPDHPTLPSLLKARNYRTALMGKWHLGYSNPNLPNAKGFDYFKGFLGDMMDDYFTHRRDGVNWMRFNEKVIDPPGHATDIFVTILDDAKICVIDNGRGIPVDMHKTEKKAALEVVFTVLHAG